MTGAPKKLIEVALPLDDINKEAAREKSIRHGHPSTLHLWWARRPLACTRAVIWASLVDDPSAHPDEFPTAQAQDAERERLFDILRRLVVWENSNDADVLGAARAEIARSMGDDVPALLDPFAGGGAIPLEAQRLGLKAHAQDLNPVAVTINKAMIEIPPAFAGLRAVNPEAQGDRGALLDWGGNAGLAADVEFYGRWMREAAEARIGRLYPKVALPHGGEAAAIAWLWARTVRCPNPACRGEAPLVRSFDLSKKKGHEWHVEPCCEDGSVRFEVAAGKSPREGTVNRRGATCLHCGAPIPFDHIRAEGRAWRLGAKLMAVVAEGGRGRMYVAPSAAQAAAANVPEPEGCPQSDLPDEALGFRVQAYGLTKHKDLFTNRQLTALVAFSDLVAEAQARATADALFAGRADDGVPLSQGGTGARAYGEAVGVYLAFVVDKLADYHSSICSWHSSRELIRNTFGRQAIPMTWDYAEGNPFCGSAGSFSNMLDWVAECLRALPQGPALAGSARQFDAQSDSGLRGVAVSCDPPYYDNIGYADLSDYFYVWLRRSLKGTYPKLFSTMLVPKAEELIAAPYRFDGGAQEADAFFEGGMLAACRQMYACARDDVPVSVYYAYKQSDTDATGTASTGWETMLSALIEAGFAITGTWPVRSELSNRPIANGANALASSIVLVCRKRPADAPAATRRELAAQLRRELRAALPRLQAANIAPVDLAQAAIGPGMGVYSRYSQVLDADGEPMGVRAALALINQELDAYLNERDGEMDPMSRLCLDLYERRGLAAAPYGEMDVAARARNVSIERMAELGLVHSGHGEVRLRGRGELPAGGLPRDAPVWLVAQRLAAAMDSGGNAACARAAAALDVDAAGRAKDLTYRLYSIAERRGWTQDAYAYNALVTSWPDVQVQAARIRAAQPVQGSLFGPETH